MKLFVFVAAGALAWLSTALGQGSPNEFCQPCCYLVNFIKSEQVREESAEESYCGQLCQQLFDNGNQWEVGLCVAVLKQAIILGTNWVEKESASQICCNDVHLCQSAQSCAASDAAFAFAKAQKPAVLPPMPMDFSQISSQQICANMAQVAQIIQGGALDAYCVKYNIDKYIPNFCEEVKKIEPEIIKAIKIVGIIFNCGDSSDVMTELLGKLPSNACADIEYILNFLKSGELEELCNEAGLPPSTCSVVEKVQTVAADALQTVADAAGCSQSAYVSYGELLQNFVF